MDARRTRRDSAIDDLEGSGRRTRLKGAARTGWEAAFRFAMRDRLGFRAWSQDSDCRGAGRGENRREAHALVAQRGRYARYIVRGMRVGVRQRAALRDDQRKREKGPCNQWNLAAHAGIVPRSQSRRLGVSAHRPSSDTFVRMYRMEIAR